MRRYLLKVSLDHFAFGLTIPVGVIWQLSRGINIEQVAIVVSIMTIITMVTDIPTGVFADNYGRKTSLATGSAVLAGSFLILAMSHSFSLFCLYGLLSGLGWALLSGAEEAYIYETSQTEGKKYRNALSDVTIVDEVATICGLAGTAIIAKFLGIQEAILFAAGLLFINAVLSIMLLAEPTMHLKNIVQIKEKATVSLTRLLKKHSSYLIIMLIFAIYYEGGRFLWQPQLVGNGVKVYQLGILFIIFKIFSIGGSFFAKKYHTTSFKAPMLLAGVALGATFILMSVNTAVIIIVGFCLYSFIENYTRVLQSDYLNELVSSHRASFLSLNNIVRNGYSAALTPVLGVIAFTHASRGFVVLAVLQIVATAAMGLIYIHNRNSV
jgi:MFS family permease